MSMMGDEATTPPGPAAAARAHRRLKQAARTAQIHQSCLGSVSQPPVCATERPHSEVCGCPHRPMIRDLMICHGSTHPCHLVSVGDASEATQSPGWAAQSARGTRQQSTIRQVLAWPFVWHTPSTLCGCCWCCPNAAAAVLELLLLHFIIL